MLKKVSFKILRPRKFHSDFCVLIAFRAKNQFEKAEILIISSFLRLSMTMVQGLNKWGSGQMGNLLCDVRPGSKLKEVPKMIFHITV